MMDKLSCAKNTIEGSHRKESVRLPLLFFALVIVLFGGTLTAGYFSYQYLVKGNIQTKFSKISAQEMELLFEDQPPETLKALKENPEILKKVINDLKELLAIAAEAETDGYSQKKLIAGQLELIERQTIAIAYDKRKTANNTSTSLSSISDADAKAFLDKPENEQKFQEFLENSKQLDSAIKNMQFSASELAEARQRWAKIYLAYERALSEKSSLNEKERRKIDLQVRLQQAQFLARKYSEEILTPKIAATIAEIEDYKGKHPEYDTKTKKAKAEQILQRVKKGENFEQIARQFSDDSGSKDKGGLYENVKKGDFLPEFERAALALEPGQIAPNVVETPYGYHIIKLIKKGTTIDASGNKAETYDVRHILISTAIAEPGNSANTNSSLGAQTPINDKIRTRIEEEKRKRLLDGFLTKHKITVAEDFKIPQNPK